MLTLQRRIVSVAALCLCAWGMDSTLNAAEGIPAERRLPQGTTVFFSVPNALEAYNEFQKTSMGRLLQDESLQTVREEIEDWWAKVSEDAEDDLGLPPSELLKLFHGEIAFAVVQPPAKDLVVQPPAKDLGVVLLMDFGDNRETLDALLERAQEALEEEDGERSVETIQETEVTIYSFVDEDADDDDEPSTLVYCIKDQYLVASSSVDIVDELLTRWDGEADGSFADDTTYSRLMQKCQAGESADPQVRWYVAPIDLFRSIASMPEANQGQVPLSMVMGFLPVLGIDKIHAVGGTATLMTDEYDTVSRTYLALDQPISGVLKIFEFPAVDQQPPRWVPDTASAYSSVNWDIEGAYKAVETLVDFFQPPGTLANLVDQLAQAGPMIHIKDDVIDSLTGRIQFLGDVREDTATSDAAVQPMAFALELSNEDTMKDVLDRIATSLDDNVETREFRDVTIYEAEMPNFQGGDPQMMGIAVARGQFFFATDVQLLESYLRDDGAGEPLANSADYRRVASHFPGQTSMMSYSKASGQVRPYYEMLRSGWLGDQIEDIDFSQLPEFDKIAHYFSLNGSYAVPDDGGALFIGFTLHNE
ncbi:MAG: hypothetical protein KDA93_26160 [Planctomycetaceae bacterium]|nr:hypothetical protein [Planctomycetaceae bacterium]